MTWTYPGKEQALVKVALVLATVVLASAMWVTGDPD
jgi:hypothetical protein